MKVDSNVLNINENVKELSDKVLIEQTDCLSEHDRGVTILILRHLREIEIRRLFVDLGYSSMHMYCIKRLKNSESQAQRRLSSARLMTELPEIEKDIKSGNLNLTNLSKIQSFVRAEKNAQHALNHDAKLELIQQCKNKPTRQVEKELIQKSHQRSLLAEKFHISLVKHNTSQADLLEQSQYVKFEVMLDLTHQELLQEFKNLYAHELQDGANISALTFLLQKAVQVKKKKLGLIPKEDTSLKKKNNAPPPSAPKVSGVQRRPIKISIQRQIWQRAESYCEHQDHKANTRCNSKFALQIDHIMPVAIGGSDDIENLRLLCRAHNSRRAVKTFGVFRDETHEG